MHPTKPLGEICEILLGGTPSRNEKEFWGGENLWCSIADMKTKIIFDTKEKITDKGIQNSNVKLLEKGTLFMSFKLSLGKLAFAGSNLYTNEAIAGLPIKNQKEIDKYFLYYFLLGYKFSKNGTDNSVKGATLNKEKLKSIPIPLPPLSIQQKIVEKLDAVLEKIEKHIELTKQNLANIEEQNTSILEKIFKECEEEFEMKELGKISENIQYGYTGNTTETGKIKYLRITDIQDNAISWEKVPFVDITEKEIAKYSLNEGDIVFARTGATVGKSCLIDKGGIGNVFASYLIRVIPDKNIINPLFLKYFFLSGTYWKQIFSEVVGSAQPNFNGTKLKSIQIPLPPLSKQQEIVTYLDNIFAKNAELKYLYEKNLKNLEELKQSILKEAFENEDFV